MLNLEHFSINRIKDGHSEKSYFLCSFGESPPHRSFHSGIIIEESLEVAYKLLGCIVPPKVRIGCILR